LNDELDLVPDKRAFVDFRPGLVGDVGCIAQRLP